MTIGNGYSTSRNACIIRLEGGKYDGESGVFDSPDIDCIGIYDWETRKTVNYVPKPGCRGVFIVERKDPSKMDAHELNDAISKEIFHYGDGDGFDPAGNYNHMHTLIEHMKGFKLKLRVTEYTDGWYAVFAESQIFDPRYDSATCPTMAVAVCRAALVAWRRGNYDGNV